MDRQQEALLQLGRTLKGSGYRFVTPTPDTHRLVNGRAGNRQGRSLQDIFGWSRPFAPDAMPAVLFGLLDAARAVEAAGGLVRSSIRFSSLGDLLLLHSAFPTEAADCVFFGPDTYRFARAIAGAAAGNGAAGSPEIVVDIGAGTGAGALIAGSLFPKARLILTDINRQALRFAEVNAALNNASGVECRQSDVLAAVPERADLILSNPPYLVDGAERLYRHGGGPWGFDLSVRIAREALQGLAPGGRLVLYTGTPIVQGVDLFLEAVRPLFADGAATFRYEEVDPDVFAEELAHPPYDAADRIAAVLLVAEAPKPRN